MSGEDTAHKHGELKPTGMHSPWGTMYQIVKETGWSWHEVMWKVTRSNMLMMMADRPGFKRVAGEDTDNGQKVEHVSGGSLAAMLRGK